MISEILARRSIRKYTDEPVSDEHVTAILEAAMSAPSAYAPPADRAASLAVQVIE